MIFKPLTTTVLVLFLSLAKATDVYRNLDDSKSSKQSKSAKGEGDSLSEDAEIYHILESMSLDLSFSMASESGKGVKKGSHSSKASKSSKSSKSAKSSKSPKSAKSSKSAKKSSKKEFDFGDWNATEAPAIMPSSSNDVPPPSSVPPPIEGLQAIEIPRFGIVYTLGQSLMPLREDVLEVAAITDEYFNSYMLDVFQEPGVENLVEFRTTFHTSKYEPDEPIIYYDSVAYFAADLPAESLPSAQTLETLLQFSLEDPAGYLDLLAQLGVENAFTFTIAVEFEDDSSTGTDSTDEETDEPPSNLSEESESTGPSSFAIAAGAIGAGLLIVGAVYYRRRKNSFSDDGSFVKGGTHGDATIAGDTFASESCDGATSTPPRNGVLQDQERGDPTQSSDTSIVAPAWEAHDDYSFEARETEGNWDNDRPSNLYDEDGSISDDIMSVASEDLQARNRLTERPQLSVAEIEAMLYS